ncbi:outer membrane beta-barrel protein [Sulfurihydrogenibium sp.]|uniref:outer membrane beta-barrel protein n=1 Tax=Sulfurihydrogenibium sp. TaxID=2053621 RepID=UPI002616C68A|nr:outer membrane beta-barrel protein [Sulfurihydrogenibium sp.]
MKKVVGLAAAGLLAVSAANAGQITVANTDITLFGGVSASYNGQNNDHALANKGFSKDSFSVNNVIIGLTKPAQDGGIGFTAAFGSWEAPTVVASSKVVNDNGLVGYGKTTDFKPWLAFVTYKPVAGLSLDAGLLWTNFGERPVTILNPHITRGVLFTANPVLLEGARGTYDAGVAKVYIGAGKAGKDQLMGPVYTGLHKYSNYIEAGITSNLKQFGLPVDVGLHTYNENGNRDIYAATVGGDLGIVSLGLEVDYFKADDGLKKAWNPIVGTTLGKTNYSASSNAWGAALCANVKPVAGVQVPVRIEYADNKDTILIPVIGTSGAGLGGNAKKVWTFTITPTYNPTKNTFLRAEVSYAKSSGALKAGQDAWLFKDANGNQKTSRTTGAVELGFLF